MSESYKIENVEALWPKINTTYRFDSTENRSVPCSALDDNSEYSLQFKMDEATAQSLYKKMNTAYKAKKQKGWEDKLPLPFEKDEEGIFIGKARLKGSYGADPTKKPSQYDAKGNKLDSDFRLTTGSKINVLVGFYPWHMGGRSGVSLRLKAVQVVKYIPMEEPSPFDKVEGFDSSSDIDEVFSDTTKEEVIEEPKKLTPKPEKKEVKTTQQADIEVSDIIYNWDD